MPPPGNAERQGVGTLANVASADSTPTPSVNDQNDIERELRVFAQGYAIGCLSRDELADARGYERARHEQDVIRGLVSAALAATLPYVKVKAAREAPIKLCGSPACNPIPRCSACVHIYAVLRRRGDYMGVMAVHSAATR